MRSNDIRVKGLPAYLAAALVLTGCSTPMPMPEPVEPAPEPEPSPVTADGPPAIGGPAPEVVAKDWINVDGPQTVAGHAGSLVLVEFWATWCPPCRDTIPHLNEVFDEYGPQGLNIISLTREDKATVETFMEEMEMKYPIGIESDSGDAYGVEGIPHATLIGADGNVIWDGHPAASEMMEAIKAAL